MEEYITFVIQNTEQDQVQTAELNGLLNRIGISCSLQAMDENHSLLEIRSDFSAYIRTTNRHAGRISYIDQKKDEVLKYAGSHTIKDTSEHFKIPERTLYRALKKWRSR